MGTKLLVEELTARKHWKDYRKTILDKRQILFTEIQFFHEHNLNHQLTLIQGVLIVGSALTK